ncbi:ATP-binding protein [Paracoccus sp. AK26]|uniref:ATP-binding protein n=1 Tax=Paracoccus sp. AK26 TaxID=2589076 RepID=UPI001427F71A|nr:ATP-binding protein [Paracoccus sp. AK26]QIR86814.1 two-component sensor histidine kinase [Paracoccus sp. AK26]
MRRPRSLQGRLALWLGLALTLVWIAAASITALIAGHELDEVFDAALQEAAQRILPLAVMDILEREDEGINQRLAAIRDHDELFTYVVRDNQDRLLLQSHAADPSIFPPWSGIGFSRSETHRFYNDDAVQGTIRITVAEPLAHRDAVAWEIQLGLGLPLLFVVPVALLVIFLAVRTNLAPLRRYRGKLATLGARDLAQVATDGLPSEMVPVADTLNGLLSRLSDAFEAERSFAANAAHELRTPLSGAIAQAQRLQAETDDPQAKARAAEIEATLKRLTRLSERLMQLARAEGGRLRRNEVADLRPVARIVVDDLSRATDDGRIALMLPDIPVWSDLDPDIFAILLRNLVDNALRYGAAGTLVDVSLTDDGVLIVANDGPVVSQDILDRIQNRFERATARGDGSGLGLAIVAATAERTGSRLDLRSPRSGQPGGFEARFTLPGP